MNEKEAMAFIEETAGYGIVPGLDSIRELCRRLGSPQKDLKFVHIAGTNGKGSVGAYISSVLKAAGFKVGRYISPVIFSYRERIQVNDRNITVKALCQGMERIKDICREMAGEGLPHPTPFDIETALGFLYFQEKCCDIVVLETGMGGLLDSTNIVENTLAAVFASISRDHMKFLGNTLEEIAAQKAGIIKKGCSVVTICQKEQAQKIISDQAQSLGCPLTVTDPETIKNIRYGLEKQRFDYLSSSGILYRRLEISLAGVVQPENAALAVEIVEALGRKGFSVSEKQLRSGLFQAKWPYRFEIAAKRPVFILDGAHNEDAAKRLAEGIRFYFTNKKILYIIGMLKDKEYEKVIAQTYAYAEQIITVTPQGQPRALPCHELALTALEYHPRVTEAASLEEAVEMAYLLAEKDWVILAFGSLSYLGALGRIIKDRSEKHDRSGKSKRGR